MRKLRRRSRPVKAVEGLWARVAGVTGILSLVFAVLTPGESACQAPLSLHPGMPTSSPAPSTPPPNVIMPPALPPTVTSQVQSGVPSTIPAPPAPATSRPTPSRRSSGATTHPPAPTTTTASLTSLQQPLPPADPVREAKIESPRDQGVVSTVIIVKGTSTGVAGSSYTIWIAVRPAGTTNFYPQNPAATVSSDGRWSADNVWVGQPGEIGLRATIYAIVATEGRFGGIQEIF